MRPDSCFSRKGFILSLKDIDDYRKEKLLKAGKIVLVLIWAGIILICLVYRNSVSVDGILNYTPENPFLAAVVLLLLFALKSVSIVIYAGILYVVSGLIFPLPVAILVNLCGSLIMRIPSDVVSLYMGAIEVDYRKYMLGSILGTIPHTITYPIIGMNVSDIRSPQFILAVCAEVVYFCVTTALYIRYKK